MILRDNAIKISRDVYLFEKDGFTALYHALYMAKVYGDSALSEVFHYLEVPKKKKEVIKKFPKNLIETLIAENIIVDENNREKEFLDSIKKNIGKFAMKNIVLLVSNDCNFKCAYCQIEENMETDRMINMPHGVAEKALDLFKKNSLPDEKKTVTITGGEPLLNMGVVKFIIEKVREELRNTRIVIFTNGSLVNKEMAEYFKDNDVLMLVSLDGPREIHDEVRKTKGGQGSFDSAMNGYRLLKEAGCKIGISAVGGTHNIKDVDKTLKFFVELAPSSIGFNFSHFLLAKQNPTEIPIADFGKVLIAFYGILRGKRIFLENISRPISAFAKSAPKINECQAQGQGFTVDARGKIGPCKSLVVSDVFSLNMDKIEKIEDNPMFRDWAMRSPFLVAECQGCPAIAICGGGCAYDSYIANNGDFKSIDKRICGYKKYILEYLIWDLFRKIKDKVLRHRFYPPSVKEAAAAFNSYYDVNNELQRSVGHENDKRG